MKKDLIDTNDWSIEELNKIIDIAFNMKANKEKIFTLLKNQTFAMHFDAPSTRTQLSFHASVVELGGHSYFIDKDSIHEEDLIDLVRVLSSYCCAFGVRLPNSGGKINIKDNMSVWKYGEGDKYLKKLSEIATIPIISLRHDTGHPCQGLYEMMTFKEIFKTKELKGKKILITWTKGEKVKPWSPTLETLRIAARFGMDITLCYPVEYELDIDVINKCKIDSSKSGARFVTTNNFKDSFIDKDIVYGRHWASKDFVLGGKTREQEETSNDEFIRKSNSWCVTERQLSLTNDAYFINPMPFEKNLEADEKIWLDTKRCLQIPLMENKLHIQKAILAYTTGTIF